MKDNDLIQRAIPYMKNANQVSRTYQNTEENEDGAMHYVMWSGGCDSTLLLYELLETYGPKNVVIVSYKYPWLFNNKRSNEDIHRAAFIAKLKTMDKKYAGKDITHIEFDVNVKAVSGEYQEACSTGLPQAVAWLLSTPIYAKENSYIYTGAIKCDDLTLHLESYHEMFRGVAKTLNKKIYLREPYLYLTKANVIEKLMKYGIYDTTWFCEIPLDVDEPCYECIPCKTHISALTELSLGSRDDIVTMQAKMALDKIKNTIEKREEKCANKSSHTEVTEG